MKPRWAAASMGAAGLALGLAACGGGSSPSATSSPASTPAASSSPAAPASTPAAPASSAPASSAGTSAASGGLTPPGTKLSFGQPATVTWIPPSEDSTKANHGIKMRVSVLSIQKGSLADFANFNLTAKEKKDTPYYVNLKLTALSGKKPPTSNDDPGFEFTAIDDRGQQQGSVTFDGTFKSCNLVDVPAHFVNGKTYSTCFTYLMPGGGSIQQVTWSDGPTPADGVSPYFDKPVVWSSH